MIINKSFLEPNLNFFFFINDLVYLQLYTSLLRFFHFDRTNNIEWWEYLFFSGDGLSPHIWKTSPWEILDPDLIYLNSNCQV
jgi:hypothetical protein